jgi:hypothetical protein
VGKDPNAGVFVTTVKDNYAFLGHSMVKASLWMFLNEPEKVGLPGITFEIREVLLNDLLSQPSHRLFG